MPDELIDRSRSGRGAPLGGIMPARSLRMTFSQFSGLAAACAGSICSSDSVAAFSAVVVAALAIFLNKLSVRIAASARQAGIDALSKTTEAEEIRKSFIGRWPPRSAEHPSSSAFQSAR